MFFIKFGRCDNSRHEKFLSWRGCYIFDHNDQLQRMALDLRRLKGKHDAVAIKKETEDALKRWNLKFDNVVVTVTDGARSMKAAFK